MTMRKGRLFILGVLLLALAFPAFGAMSDDEFIELCKSGTAQRVTDAIKAGANVNAKGGRGWTALMGAAGRNKNPEVIAALVNAGADVNAKDNDGRTAIDLARRENNAAAVKALEEAKIAQIRKAAENGDAEAQYQLGLMYAKGDGVEEDQWEAVDWLRKAAKQGHKPARNELAKRGIYE